MGDWFCSVFSWNKTLFFTIFLATVYVFFTCVTENLSPSFRFSFPLLKKHSPSHSQLLESAFFLSSMPSPFCILLFPDSSCVALRCVACMQRKAQNEWRAQEESQVGFLQRLSLGVNSIFYFFALFQGGLVWHVCFLILFYSFPILYYWIGSKLAQYFVSIVGFCVNHALIRVFLNKHTYISKYIYI